ncbi:3-hydroxyacyl-CoA dehydrogenase NAD-binding domain-containing protein [Roseisalinus antarcticus]|uniref:L-carnitine dehydrogenase n=1 Tax=Roseisalinus antarcticus TaxID=254357 RepID=A0A1Y5RU93_9RHOB|nr:3-hydroxyacyl-CoA dehydrogenase NAD-binding domain-containing protein [Roseisalinus antarcticus]SLN25618.1 L-carnitine dehydrogenase [Roseisalinus antarcticus]
MSRVACIGAGLVGCGWAAVFARAGREVRLYDIDPDAIEARALPMIRAVLEDLEAQGMGGPTADEAFARISGSDTVAAAVEAADYVQESAREDLEVKQALFAEIAAHASAGCILASSTSALPGSSFLTAIPAPERALVAHPVNPPSHIPLVELCGTGKTSEATIAAAHRFLSDAGMEPVTLHKEIDGFLLNRLQFTLVAEAMHLVAEGYCSAEDIDKVMTSGLALRWSTLGPFMTVHLNAAGGFNGFVEQLGPMMKHLGRSARTDYDWTPEQADRIRQWLDAACPVAEISQAQQTRNRNILATRRLQGGDDRD